MTADPLELLRASNPVPRGSSAPSIERVLERIHAERSARRRWRKWPSAVVPALGAATAVGAVAVVAVFVLATHHRSGVSQPAMKSTVSTTPSPVPARPMHGMHGLVSVQGAAFPSPLDGLISLQQCLGCGDNGNQTARSADSYWLARTADGGRTWSLTKEGYYIQEPLFVGRDGWAGGLQAQGSQAGGIAQYYVTHDGGRTWSIAPAAAPNEGGALVSVGGGEVWATGVTPATVTILHSPATGSRLNATASQPIHGNWTNVKVIAGGPGSAYVSNPDAARGTFVTHDDGRSWQRLPPPCPHGDPGGLAAAYGETVWASCSSKSHQPEVLRSNNGGASWLQLQSVVGSAVVQPVSAAVAWAYSGSTVLRTTNAGLTWSTVWSAANSQPPSLRSQASPPAAGFIPLLSAQSPTAASVVMTLVSGQRGKRAKYTDLVVYRTSNGGATWHPSVVPLPAH